MKKLLYTFAIAAGLLIIGCQENSITNPVQPDPSGTLNKISSTNIHNGSITLEGLLSDPHPVMNSFYMIKGEVHYSQSLFRITPAPMNSRFVFKLKLSVYAEFSNYCTVCNPPTNENNAGTISTETSDVIHLTDSENYTLVKSYPIKGRDDGMTLNCRYVVSAENVSLNSMWLELDNIYRNDNSTY